MIEQIAYANSVETKLRATEANRHWTQKNVSPDPSFIDIGNGIVTVLTVVIMLLMAVHLIFSVQK